MSTGHGNCLQCSSSDPINHTPLLTACSGGKETLASRAQAQ